jgi:hypothetical protein
MVWRGSKTYLRKVVAECQRIMGWEENKRTLITY